MTAGALQHIFRVRRRAEKPVRKPESGTNGMRSPVGPDQRLPRRRLAVLMHGAGNQFAGRVYRAWPVRSGNRSMCLAALTSRGREALVSVLSGKVWVACIS